MSKGLTRVVGRAWDDTRSPRSQAGEKRKGVYTKEGMPAITSPTEKLAGLDQSGG